MFEKAKFYESQRMAHTKPQACKRLIKKIWYVNKALEVRLGVSKAIGVTEYAEKTSHGIDTLGITGKSKKVKMLYT